MKVWEWGCDLSDSLSKSSGRINREVWLSEKDKRYAASDAANMHDNGTMKKHAEPGIIIKQPETLASWSNLVWNLIKEADKISGDKAA